MTNSNQPTERQIEAFPRYVAEAQRYIDTYTLPTDMNSWDWVTTTLHTTILAIYSDGDYLVEIVLDKYGFGSVHVGEPFWIHHSDDEDCGCNYCEEERGQK